MNTGKMEKQVISVYRSVKDAKTGEKLGILMVTIDYKVIRGIVESIDLGPESSFMILSENNDVIYRSRQDIPIDLLVKISSGTGSKNENSTCLLDNNKVIVVYKISSFSKWKMAAFVPESYLIKDAKDIGYLIVFVAIGCVIIGIIVSLVLASHVTSPIKTLVSLMRRVEKGDFDGQIEVKSRDEIGRLASSYNLMLSRLRELIDKIYKEQEQKRKAEYKALEMQINPHFLYNTLYSIKWVAVLQKANNAAEMITYLVRLLKISLNKGREYVSVREEIEHAKCYVEIQKFRYNNKFEVHFHIHDNLLDCKIPKLILQPIIENSIFHGFGKMVQGGQINVVYTREDNDIRFSVIDNGCGINSSEIGNLLESGRRPGKGDRLSGIGLNNVNERNKLLYGDKYGLTIENAGGGGARVDVLLPQIIEIMEEDA